MNEIFAKLQLYLNYPFVRYAFIAGILISLCSSLLGITLKMRGQFALFEDMENGKPFYACVIPDVTECCLQGFEFAPLSEYNYPKDYPEVDSTITIIGKFEYDENNFGYCRLIDVRFVR